MSACREYCVTSLVQSSATECGVSACDCEADNEEALAHYGLLCPGGGGDTGRNSTKIVLNANRLASRSSLRLYTNSQR
jgi:hypothetical protein